MDRFDSFTLRPSTLDAIAAKGYEEPTPIQTLSLPPLLAKRDLIAQAQTGTGKTAAFGIPLIDNHREGGVDGVNALVLVPTRELAIQVAEELKALAKGSGLHIATVYGGVGFGNQNHALQRRGVTILVATPGRLLDHLDRGTTDLDNVRTVILDEADRMLDMGFVHDVEKILRETPKDRQTALFSATLSKEILRLSQRYLRNPETVKIETTSATVDKVQQYHVRVEKADKQGHLLHLLHAETPERAIVFTRTKHLAKRLAERLQKQGWGSVALQGNMSQPQRERAIGAFRSGHVRILVATDVAARGIDVPEISHIVNYDLPDGADTYIHRVGRTARMGRTGRAFTFVQSDQVRDFKAIKRTSGADAPHHQILMEPPEAPRGPDTYRPLPTPQQPPRGQGGHGGPRRNHGPRRGGPGGQGGQGRPRSGGPRRSGQGGGQGPRSGGPRRGGPRRSGNGGPRNGPRNGSQGGSSGGPRPYRASRA
jgi:ATP-dependent RNA helicase RhlE